MTKPNYVYVASSWRNEMQPKVCAALAAVGIDHYDFKNPEGGTGFSWKQVKTDVASVTLCEHCDREIVFSSFRALGYWEPDLDRDPVVWRHRKGGYAGCDMSSRRFAEPSRTPPKGSDWESIDEYLRMVNHPTAVAGFESDFGAMKRADTFVLVLPCGKSAHLELGWAVGAGKRTAILLEDPVEPELMYRMVDHLATSIDDLLGWHGVADGEAVPPAASPSVIVEETSPGHVAEINKHLADRITVVD